MVTTTNLLFYYKCDENAANTSVADSHSTLTGTATTNTSNLYDASGIINSRFDFNGTSERITNGLSTTLTAFSYSFWMEWDDLGTSTTQVIFEGDNNSEAAILTGGSANNDLRIIDNGGGTVYTFTGAIQSGMNHYVATYNGTNTILYRNGSLVQSQAATGQSIVMGGLNIAARQGGSLYFNGKLDEIGMWSTAITLSDAQDLYNSGAGLAYPFVADITINPSTATASTTQQSPTYYMDIFAGPLVACACQYIPTTTGAVTGDIVGTGTIGSKYLINTWPNVEGLTARVTKQTGNPNLVETDPQSSW